MGDEQSKAEGLPDQDEVIDNPKDQSFGGGDLNKTVIDKPADKDDKSQKSGTKSQGGGGE